MKESKFRKVLALYTHHEITLHCNQFEMRQRENEEDIETLLLLKEPAVLKIAGRKRKGTWIIDHLWIKVPKDRAAYFVRYLPLARKIKIDGDIYQYFYKESGNPQAGVKAKNIQILKYKKDIAKKYHLQPGQQLSKKTMEKILLQSNEECTPHI